MRRCPLVKRELALAFGIALTICAADAQAIFIVNQPWLRPAAQGRSTEAYMDLTSTEGAVLVSARAEIATVSILTPGKASRATERLPLPAQKMVSLAPGGYRLLLAKLARTIKRGDRVLMTITIEAADGSRQEIPVDAEARFNSPIADERRAHGVH
jgi:copper(I)-binding protein